MRRFVMLCAALATVAMPSLALAEDVKVVIPEGTLVLTHLAEPMSSAKAHTGDVFQFVVTKDVVVNKLVAIRANSKGVGHVTEAHAAGSHGKSGGLRLAFDYIFAPDGSQIAVAHNKQAEEKTARRSAQPRWASCSPAAWGCSSTTSSTAATSRFPPTRRPS